MAQPNLLSNREEEVVALLLQGKSNKLIASALGISDSTVEFHLKNIYAKFQVSSRVELILKLKNASDQAETEQLGLSVVDGEGEKTVNRDRPSLWNWDISFRDAVSIIGKEFKKMENVLKTDTRDGAKTMSFFESIRVCLIKYAEFNGRASRAEFWWFTLFVILVASALTYLNTNFGSVFMIAALLPQLAVGSRRLHDIGRSGWWQLFLLVPVAGIVVPAILWAMPSTSQVPDDTRPA